MIKILSIGNFLMSSNTAFHRSKSLEEISDEFDYVNSEGISIFWKISNKLFRLGLNTKLPDILGLNRKIINLVKSKSYDIIWIDKGLTVNKSTLVEIKKNLPDCKIVSYSADNMSLRHNQSANFLECFKLYDFHITTKSLIIDKLYKMGAKNVIFTFQSFEKKYHYPRILTKSDLKKYSADVGFIGVWEKERFESLLFLAKKGIKVKVFGLGKWKKYINTNNNLNIISSGLFSEEYCKALQAFKISICFLRKLNNDLHTSRSMEIPACGGFMIAERNDEHKKLFEENREAIYFSDNNELFEKCNYFLHNEVERDKIRKNGYNRCINSNYSNFETLKHLINKILKNTI